MVKRYRGGLISATDYNENGLRAGSMFTLSDRAQITAANAIGWFVPPPTIEYLVIAGGGAGGTGYYGGGAGAGGYLTANLVIPSFGNITVVVGAGGAFSPSISVQGGNGASSNISGNFTTVNAVGGGGGGSRGAPGTPGLNGGSGGGSAFPAATGGSGYQYPGPTQQGYPGGSDGYGASGGGAGAAGTGNGPSATQLAGGIGLQSSITGTAIYYAGGGGGGNQSPLGGGQGGLGGGGRGGTIGSPPAVATAGLTNTGGGGGGGGDLNSVGGNGGSGVVILRWPTSGNNATANTGSNVLYSNTGGYHTYRFYSSGTITI